MSRLNWPRCNKCNSQNTMLIEAWFGEARSWKPHDDIGDAYCTHGKPDEVWTSCFDCGCECKILGVKGIDERWWEEEDENN